MLRPIECDHGRHVRSLFRPLQEKSMASALPDPQVRRNYLLPRRRRLSRHLRAHGYRSLIGGITATGVLAGFLSASEVHWNLLTYIAVATFAAAVILCALGLRTLPWYGLPVVGPFLNRRGARQSVPE